MSRVEHDLEPAASEALEANTAALTEKITAHLATLPGVPAACTSCGVIGEHADDCADR